MAGEIWTQLPVGKPINVQGGYYYAALAALKKNHTEADVHALLKSRGMQEVEYIDNYTGEPNPEGSNYRLVVAVVYAPQNAGVLPWGVPSPASFVDSTHLVRAYAAPMKKGLPPAPPSPPSADEFPWGPVLGVAGVAGAGAFAWWWLRRRKTAR